nr:PREDICTED: nuclear pore complex protein Nup85 [Bemisia tabaci]
MVRPARKAETSAPIITIPDPACNQVGLAAKWVGIDKLAVHACEHKTVDSPDSRSGVAPIDSKVHYLRQDVVLFDPIVRKLVNEASGLFIAGQSIRPATGLEPRSDTVKLSRQYRSILHDCIEHLQEESTKQKKEYYSRYVAIFYNIEFVWHLCEILYVDVVAGDIVLPQLTDWIKFHFSEHERIADTILTGYAGSRELTSSGAETLHPEYWNTIIGLILQGNMEHSRALLRLHSLADTEPFLQAHKFLRSRPVYSVYGGLSLGEFTIRWKTWQSTVQSEIHSGTFSSQKHLLTIMKIVIGDESITEVIRKYCSTWYQYMVALLLYTDPTVKSYDLSYHAQQCINAYGGQERLKLLDVLILALLESDLQQVIQKLQFTSDSGWAVSHLSNLLYLCGRISFDKNYSKDSDSIQRLDERLLLDYGTLLLSHHSLWQIGVTYLDHCPSEGRARLELCLSALPIDNEARAKRIIQIAQEREMADVVASICKVLGMRSLKQNRLGNALVWAFRSQDSAFATHLADLFLQRYNKDGVFQSSDILDHLGSAMLICDRLTFLGKYCEFHQHYRNNQLKEAAILLTELLVSKLSPKYFWLTLLTDALPLLDSELEPILSYSDTCQFLYCLEELISERLDSPTSQYSSQFEEKVKLIRLALAKNMARTLTLEACVPSNVTANSTMLGILKI